MVLTLYTAFPAVDGVATVRDSAVVSPTLMSLQYSSYFEIATPVPAPPAFHVTFTFSPV